MLCGRDVEVVDDRPAEGLLAPNHVTTRAEVVSRPSSVPAEPGVYAWYFDEPPSAVPLAGTHRTDFGYLLYIGIAPRKQRIGDGRPSKQNLRRRIRNHYNGNASGSTLRLTLGSLLASDLGIKLRRVGSGSRFTFGAAEAPLSEWMGQHARVCWVIDPEP